ncbi:MAG: undecaprenyl-diphosphate phosphatase [Oscillospiraceae bacterium]|nr:undecaprenyl-diphosphate phosphatase [Oscillospiraceae bacterium]
MSVLSAVFLGLVQGLTEFLPVSSSGHLSVLQNLFVMETSENGRLFFDVMLHVGTLVSICAVYRKGIAEMALLLTGFIKNGGQPRYEMKKPVKAQRLIIMLAASVLPLFLIIPVRKYTEKLFYSTVFIGIALIITGIMLFVSDKFAPGKKNERNMTVKDALIVGLCQAVAVIPGLSRSGATISGGLACGFDREFSIRFSFLMSIPAVLGATLITLVDAFKEGIEVSLIPVFLLGAVVAAGAGIAAIKLIERLSLRGHFGKFAYYCWIIGLLTVILTLIA